MTERRCNRCGQTKPLDEFVKNRSMPLGYDYKCRACWRLRSWLDKLAKFGMTEDDWLALYEQQDGKCAICKTTFERRRLNLDHNHRTNQARGLLCDKCNHGIGLLGDSVETLTAAANYLRQYQRK